MTETGYPLPDEIDPSTRKCVCVPIPNDPAHIRAFLGQLDALSRWYNWERDEFHTGRDVAYVWRQITAIVREELDMDCGCGGGTATPDQQRYDEYGELEVSYDGGVTWEDGEDIDGRFNSPLLPALPGTSEEKACNTAHGAAAFMEAHIYDQIDLVSTLAAMVSLIGSVLAMVASAGSAYPIVTALSGSILAFGTGVVRAALSAEVMATFACLLYCRLDENGKLTTENWRGLQDDITDEFTGVAAEVLRGTVQAFGTVGITNSGRVIKETGHDCSACGCGEWVEYFLAEHGQRGVTPTAWPTSNFCAGSYSGGKLIGCCGGTGTGHRIRASLNFAEANITRVIMHTETRAQSSSSDEQLIYNGLTEIITVGTPTGETTTIVDSGPIDIMSGELIFRVSAAMGSATCAGTTSYARIALIEIHGTGFNPFA